MTACRVTLKQNLELGTPQELSSGSSKVSYISFFLGSRSAAHKNECLEGELPLTLWKGLGKHSGMPTGYLFSLHMKKH